MLVTDAETRMAIWIMKSLAKRQIRVVCASDTPWAASFFSRYCGGKVLYPSYGENANRFITALQAIVRKRKFDTLIPSTDPVLLAISENREQLRRYVNLPFPSHESVLKALDKSLTIQTAIENDVPIPRTYFVKNDKDLLSVSKVIKYPVAVKPRFSHARQNGRMLMRRSTYASNRPQLIRAYRMIHKDFPYPLVQEYVHGQNYSVAVLFNHGNLVAACCIKVYRGTPVTGGTSVLRESVPLDPVMLQHSTRLLKALDWHGIAEVEFKLDSQDLQPKLMEINARFWASLDVAIKSGVDFPYMLYCLSLDGKVKPAFNYRTGVKSRWLMGDMQYLMTILSGWQRIKGVPRPSRSQVLRDFLRFYEPDIHYDLVDLDDPLPFFPAEITHLLRIARARKRL